MENEIINQRKEKVLTFFQKKKFIWILLLLFIIIYLGFSIRLENLGNLQDTTTGQYVPLALDPLAVLRYVEYYQEHGALMDVDTLRYHPIGFTGVKEFQVLAVSINILHKALTVFNPDITIQFSHVIYPPIAFAIGMLFFFLVILKLFDWRVALLSSAFLSVIPVYLFRTIAGFSDKEALGMMFLFIAFYCYVSSWTSKKTRNIIILSLLAGLFTGLMGLTWGGGVMLYLIFGGVALIEILLKKFEKRDFLAYTVWLLSSFVVLHIGNPQAYPYLNFFSSFTTQIAIFALGVGIVYYVINKFNLFKLKTAFAHKIPLPILSFLITILFGIVLFTIIYGPGYIFDKIQSIYISLVEPFGVTRWHLTVAESHQPYFIDWVAQLNWKYVIMFMLGSIFLFYETLKFLKTKARVIFSLLYGAFIFVFAMSRYKAGSVFDGVTPFSRTLYIGSFIVFILILVISYLYTFYKKPELFKKISTFEKTPTFVFIWFLLMIIAARSAVRLLFIFGPITAVLAAYFVTWLIDKIKAATKKWNIWSIIGVALILLFALSIFTGFAQNTKAQAQSYGLSYNSQWQQAMQWVRENTPEDSVFAHWWDYGYWVQYGGQRATLSDGGNARGAINHFIGRHLLMAENDTEALELLKANEATHVLIIADEIGKYPAFSSIGSDENYDRYSWVPNFQLDPSQAYEDREGEVHVFRSVSSGALDEDIIYGDQVFPAQSAGIAAVLIPTVPSETEQTAIRQPLIVLVYNGQQTQIPIQCIKFGDRIIEYPEYGIEGCFVTIPKIDGQRMNNLGAGMWLSKRVKNTFFGSYYILGKESEHFKIVYNDQEGVPLAAYNGISIGPIKIWEISYPDNLDVPEKYYGTELPNPDVNRVRR